MTHEVGKILSEVQLTLHKQQAATGFSWEDTVVLNFGTEQQKSAASTRLRRQREAGEALTAPHLDRAQRCQASIGSTVLAGAAIPAAGYLLCRLLRRK